MTALNTSGRRREHAQVIVLFAVALLAMLAMVGVAVDGGTLYVQRRTAQNAADAAALAGTRALQQATISPTATIATEICNYLASNSFGVTPSGSAYFVNTSGSSLGTMALPSPSNCAAGALNVIPNGASGVHVDVTIGPYNTYLAGLVGIRTLSAQASATAQVGVVSIPYPDLTPLAGCGPDMLIDPGTSSNSVNILNATMDGIDPQYYYSNGGPAMVLQGSQMTQNETAACPVWNGNSSSWKGQITTSGITGTFTVPPAQEVPVNTGNSSIDTIIVNMCTTLYPAPADPTNGGTCYLMVPIAAPPNPSNEANIVTVACFKIVAGSSGYDKWVGLLYPPAYCGYGITPPTWTWGNTFSGTTVELTQ